MYAPSKSFFFKWTAILTTTKTCKRAIFNTYNKVTAQNMINLSIF